MKPKKKPSPVGCIVYTIVLVLVYIVTPLLLAISFTFFSFFVVIIGHSIILKAKKIKLRNKTNKSTISTAQEGYVELVARIKDGDPQLKTWLTGESADYRWLSFNRYVGRSGSGSGKGKWSSFFDHESAEKVLSVTDGSGDCNVSLHRADFRIKTTTKFFKSIDLLKKLKDHGIDGFPYHDLEANKEIDVTEQWIPKNETVSFYGNLHKLSLDQTSHALIEDNIVMRGSNRLEHARFLETEDYQRLTRKEKEEGGQSLKILTSNYDSNPVEGLIISLKGDKSINQRSYATIIFLSFAMLVLFFIGGVHHGGGVS